MAIWGLILGVLAAVVGTGAPVDWGRNQVENHIQVLSASHELDFPSRVTLRLEVGSSTEITEVEIFYRLGNQEVTSYGYPGFSPALRVSTEFVLRADGDGFIPQGTDISYRYVITNSSGQVLETDEYSLEFLDASQAWQRLFVGDMEILFHDRSAEGVETIAKDVAHRLEDVKQLLGITSIRPQKAVILNSGRESLESFPPISQTTSDRHVYGGFAFGDMDVFVLADLDRDGMVHEMTHLYMDEALNAPGTRTPAWLNEGLAMYFEAGDKGRGRTVSRAALSGDLLPIRSMDRVPGRPEDVSLFYAQSWSLTSYLMDSHGAEGMVRLLDSMKQGRPFEGAFSGVYGFGTDELERQWRSNIMRGATISALPDPGTLGTAVIIAGAMLFAMLAIFVRRLRRVEDPFEEGDVDFYQ
ncbi:MAG: hypothetical protein BZY79_00100 [SAR202 cluster bacterium Casp-Chloro-G4]|nr:peptidase MA family metallohydrolase [Chloroflexota bacterium]PKB62149.1 MAG: hypothetical protein BZY79_00100 [SAR202 cluster bacterium Casp-Chloro-G4]